MQGINEEGKVNLAGAVMRVPETRRVAFETGRHSDALAHEPPTPRH